MYIQQLGAAYNAIVEEESIMSDFRILEPLSTKEARDIEEALKGDYKQNFHLEEEAIFLLPKFRNFEDRLDDSAFDNMNVESTALKYRFLVPFIIKAELSPGLAFGEVLLTWIHILTRKFSILRRGYEW